jgi:hypothetical protein
MRNKLNSVKNHFNRNRFCYGIATGTVLTTAGTCAVLKLAIEWRDFTYENVTPHMTTAE